MNPSLTSWALRWSIPFQALQELNGIFGIVPPAAGLASQIPHTEAYVQSLVRLEAARKGVKLWRNNVGVLQDVTGRPVRYGLGNDSPALNKMLKSGDLIGWRPLLVTPGMVGAKVAQFISRECKRADWNYLGNEHELAQLKWIEAINVDGGDARFVTGEGSL